MADTFVSVTWVADELVTSTKLNQAMANQANFHNGTALGDGIIVTRHLGSTANLKLPAGNIDFTTTLLGIALGTSSVSFGGSDVTIASLATFTVPAGVTKIKLTFSCDSAYFSSGTGFITLTIQDSGTGVAAKNIGTLATNVQTNVDRTFIINVTPGASKTFTITGKVGAGATGNVLANSASPIIFIAEAAG